MTKTSQVPATQLPIIDPECMVIRRKSFPDEIRFHTPGLQRYATSEYDCHDARSFVSISVTGSACALSCEHCKMRVLHGMTDLAETDGSLFDLCARLKEQGASGVLISGGCDSQGRVPLLAHMEDLKRARRELGLILRVHPGLPDEKTGAGLGAVGIDGAMVDMIGSEETIRDVYHLDAKTCDYEAVLERLEIHGVPTVPHIVLGLHFGRMLGEWNALDMVTRHPPKLLVLVILMPLSGTPMALSEPPSLAEIGGFFESARRALPRTPVMLGCARPLGEMKTHIDTLAVDAGLNGIAYPADGIVAYARERGLAATFIDACCGVQW